MSDGLLIVPRLRVQNANGISAPMTWGFPSMTSFLGLMWALERKVAPRLPIIFKEVGVVCHDFAPQVSMDNYVNVFHLKRQPPITKKEQENFLKGTPPSIVEECRVHMTISLVFRVGGEALNEGVEALSVTAARIAETLQSMRIAGGSVLPVKYPRRPELHILSQDSGERQAQFHELRRALLPGFTLVSRHDLLESHLRELQATNADATLWDAWLNLSCLTWRAEMPETPEDGHSAPAPAAPDATTPPATPAHPPTGLDAKAEWKHNRTQGWIVPIPVGYGALSPLHPAGAVARARDTTTPFRFVESIYSIGQWIGPHRLDDVSQMLWYAEYDEENGVYNCCNDYAAAPAL